MKSYYRGKEVLSIHHGGREAFALISGGTLSFLGDYTPATTIPVTDPPYANTGGVTSITGARNGGATLTAPSWTWNNADTVTRSWLVGDEVVATGATTFAGGVDGDTVYYREVAVNVAGSTTKKSSPFFVSDPAQHFQETALAEIEGMLDGAVGGAAEMEVFSYVDHDTPSYTRNISLWAEPLVPQLCSAVAWKNLGTMESYGGILISPRHVLYCYHAHPHAEDTWLYPRGQDTVLRWVLPDNSIVEAIQICQYDRSEAKPGYASLESLGLAANLDLCVATLDRDVEALGVPVMPILQLRSIYEWSAYFENETPIINVSQGSGRETDKVPYPQISDYPYYNKSMVCIGPYIRSTEPTSLFDYKAWDGDSGTPVFIVCDGVVYLHGVMMTPYWGRLPIGIYIDAVNGMIAASDAGAVAMGRMEAPTGITVTTVAPMPPS